MTQDTINPLRQDDEEEEEAVIDQLVHEQDIHPEEVSPEQRRQLDEELDYQNRAEIPRPSEDGDGDNDLGERRVTQDEHGNI
jgi:hypothetical protein